MTQTLALRERPAAILAASAELASLRILACLLPVRPPRHRERRTKCRQQFPSSPAAGRVPASTGKVAVTIYPAGQITYADGHTGPRHAQVAVRPPRRHLLTSPACANDTQGGKPRPAVEPAPAPGRYPGRRHPRRHSETPRQSYTGISRSIQLKECLTPKSDGVGVTRRARIGADFGYLW